jgi:hypothetical protein
MINAPRTLSGDMCNLIAPNTASDGEKLYHSIIGGDRLYSKVFRVNKESRTAGLQVYRGQLPCRFARSGWGDRTAFSKAAAVLYFNTEHEFLHTGGMTAEHDFADFLHRMKTEHDPLRVGGSGVAGLLGA